MAKEIERVGPVLEAGAVSEAVIAAILEMNPGTEILDRGAYLRVLSPGQCKVQKSAIERYLGKAFRLPSDLEKLMPSFKGKFVISGDEVRWTSEKE